MTDHGVREALESLASKLRISADDVSIRGSDRARFVYATTGPRAVEASLDEAGSIWVEYWVDILNEDAPAARDETFASIEAAAASIANWLTGEASKGLPFSTDET